MNYPLTLSAPIVGSLIFIELICGTTLIASILDIFSGTARGYIVTTLLICFTIGTLNLFLIFGSSSIITHISNFHYPINRYQQFIKVSVGYIVLLLFSSAFSYVSTDKARKISLSIVSMVTIYYLFITAFSIAPLFPISNSAEISIIPSSLLLGTSFGGMLLGHWYLISPDLTFKPLRFSVYLVFLAVIIQLITFIFIFFAIFPSGISIISNNGLFIPFWLLVIGGDIVFTPSVNALTLYFAKIRANQPATAMLYTLIIGTMMATIPAQLIYFKTGIPL